MKKLFLLLIVLLIGVTSFGQKLKYVYTLPLPGSKITAKLQIGDPIWVESVKQLITAKTVLPVGYTIPASWYLDTSPMRYTTVSITDTTLVTTLGATPQTLIAAPGTGKAIKVISAILAITVISGTLEITAQDLIIRTNTSSSTSWKFTNAAYETAASVVLEGVPPTTSGVLVANKAIEAAYSAGTNKTGTGKATLKFYLTYQIVTL